jgi:hypothetical protein
MSTRDDHIYEIEGFSEGSSSEEYLTDYPHWYEYSCRDIDLIDWCEDYPDSTSESSSEEVNL